jgi:hypothetical protein
VEVGSQRLQVDLQVRRAAKTGSIARCHLELAVERVVVLQMRALVVQAVMPQSVQVAVVAVAAPLAALAAKAAMALFPLHVGEVRNDFN